MLSQLINKYIQKNMKNIFVVAVVEDIISHLTCIIFKSEKKYH